MTKDEAKNLAKIIYKEINPLVDKWEDIKEYDISLCWDRCIRINEFLFSERELIDE